MFDLAMMVLLWWWPGSSSHYGAMLADLLVARSGVIHELPQVFLATWLRISFS